MQFNSFIFIFLLLPVTVLLYFLCNKIHRTAGKIILIISSLIFYSYSDISALIFICFSLLSNYIFVRLMLRKRESSLRLARVFLIIPLVINIGLLIYFKYTGFILSCFNVVLEEGNSLASLILPLGISFITFQQIAYVVSVYNHELENADLIDYLTYILYFPKILMGPLAEPADFISQLNDSSLKKFSWDNFAYGLKMFSFGLFKKVMIADVFMWAVGWSIEEPLVLSSLDWILVTLFYTFSIYFDFSGYSDMAVGSSLMLNITLPINFDSPYKALSIRDFWKRWHISLTKFFTKYIYIPLGGSRKGKLLTYVNTMIVFGISGLWHGANWSFILWGILHGLFMIFDRIFEKQEAKIPKPIRWLFTFIVINVLWLLFWTESVSKWIFVLIKIISLQGMTVSPEIIHMFELPETSLFSDLLHLNTITGNAPWFWMLVYTIIAFILCLVPQNNYRNIKKISFPIMILVSIAFVWGVICLSSESVFVYFNF